MEKLTLQQLGADTSKWSKAVVVFKQESFDREFSETERSYAVNSDAKYFDGSMIGNSLFGNCLDGQDNGVRLDWYMSPEKGKAWVVDYCYIMQGE
jgi:hypothetical protein